MLGDSGTSVLVFGASCADTVDALDAATRPSLIAVDGGHAGCARLRERDRAMPDRAPIIVDIDLDAPCMIMYTSGTTGRPKGAVLTHNNIIWNCLNVLVDVDLRSDEVTLVTAPMFHTAALNMTCLPTLLKGGRLVIEPKFDADAVIDAIEQRRVTLLFGVPTMFAALTQSPRWASADLSSLRLLLCGGAPVPTSLITTYQRARARVRAGLRDDGDRARSAHGRSRARPPDGRCSRRRALLHRRADRARRSGRSGAR